MSKWLTEGLNFLWVCFACLLFICFFLYFCCSFPNFICSVVWKCVAYRNNQCISIRSICGYEECLLMEKMYFQGLLQVGFLSFSCLPLGTVLVCLWKQTDSEQTDFAFDGEMTATEVCTSRKEAIFRAWEKLLMEQRNKVMLNHRCKKTFGRIYAPEVMHVMHALHFVTQF